MRTLLALMLLVLCVKTSAQGLAPVYIQISVDNTTPYIGQPITLLIRAFDSTRTQGLQISYPSLATFGQDVAADVQITSEVINGVPYTVYAQDIILYPNRSGTFIIDPATLVMPETPLTSEVRFESNQLVVNVQPLPLPAPSGFTNAVGQLTASTRLNQTSIGANESVTLTLTITGTGNLARIQPPLWRVDAAEWRQLPPQRLVSPSTTDLSFSWTLLPQRSGVLQVSPFQFSSFDATTGRYQTYEFPGATISVGVGLSPDRATASPPPSTPIPPTLVVPSQTIASGRLGDALPTLTPPIEFWLIPLLIMGVGILITGLRGRAMPSVVTMVPRRRAPSDMKAALMHAMRQPPVTAFPELEAVFRKALQERASVYNHSLEEWLSTLPNSLQDRIGIQLQSLASARFAPATSEDVHQHAQDVYRLVRQIDRVMENEVE